MLATIQHGSRGCRPAACGGRPDARPGAAPASACSRRAILQHQPASVLTRSSPASGSSPAQPSSSRSALLVDEAPPAGPASSSSAPPADADAHGTEGGSVGGIGGRVEAAASTSSQPGLDAPPQDKRQLWMAAAKPPMYSVGFMPVLVRSKKASTPQGAHCKAQSRLRLLEACKGFPW